MDELLNFLFSVVFVLIGSLAFHISALVSGENIYRDLPTLEATLLSTVAGIVIFLLSPISFIIFYPTDYLNISAQILDFWVLLAFFSCAFGLGLIFGCVALLKARLNLLLWFRRQTGMKFKIYTYGFTWDDFLGSVKQKGEVFVQTDAGIFKGLLGITSIRDEPREIVLENSKIKRYGIERDIEGKENVDILIPESEIKRIIVPERSFKKHHESMQHISQAFYCISLAIGLFFLSCSAYLTENYMPNLELASESLASLMFFYHTLSLFFLVLTILCLGISVWTAKIDFNSWRAFLTLSPDIAFVPLFFLLAILLIIFSTQILQILQILQIFILILVLLFIYLLLLFIYIRMIRNWFLRHVEKCFDDIKKDFKGYRKLLKEVLQRFYLQLSCNEIDQACISSIKNKILEEYTNDDERDKIKGLIKKLDKLKGYLFSVDLIFEDDLNTGIVSKGLKDEFEAKNIPLPNTPISQIKGDNKWVIIDKKRKKTYYIVWKEDEKLKIFKKGREYLKEEDFNIISSFAYFIENG
jgi:hypothetical protein